jgi:hypothetical protein
MYYQIEAQEEQEDPQLDDGRSSKTHAPLAYCVGMVAFAFQFYCVWATFGPTPMAILGDSNQEGHVASDYTDTCTVEDFYEAVAAGAVFMVFLLFIVIVCSSRICVDMGPCGPLAGGCFAYNMGAGLVAGSAMSVAQSAAMWGGFCGTFYGVGAAFGASMAALVRCRIQFFVN